MYNEKQTTTTEGAQRTMATESAVRYPYQAILDKVLGRGEAPKADRTMAVMLGVSERQTRRARQNLEDGDGTVDAYLADAMAVGAGLVPALIFGPAWDHPALFGTLDAEAEAADERKRRLDARKAAAA